MKLNAFRFALAAGIVGAVGYAWTTLAALLHVPGFAPFADLLEAGYGPYGYSVSMLGVVVATAFGFVEGFVWLGAFAWTYNRLLGRKRTHRNASARGEEPATVAAGGRSPAP